MRIPVTRRKRDKETKRQRDKETKRKREKEKEKKNRESRIETIPVKLKPGNVWWCGVARWASLEV